MRSKGLAKGGDLSNCIVLDESSILNKEGLRYKEEFVRHKIYIRVFAVRRKAKRRALKEHIRLFNSHNTERIHYGGCGKVQAYHPTPAHSERYVFNNSHAFSMAVLPFEYITKAKSCQSICYS